ncbi:hypothetical protein A7G45_01950 [Mycolicibacterium llatzerense]|nr:hypothetical protein [Mycolicibacterium llatzerense]
MLNQRNHHAYNGSDSQMDKVYTCVDWVVMTATRPPLAGDRVRVSHGVFGRLGRVSSTSAGHFVIRYDDGAREVIDPTRRQLWVQQ